MKMSTALVTGSAKRIGKEIALFLAGRGFNIALHYNTSKTEAEKIQGEIEKLTVKCKLFKCDLSLQDKTSGLIEEVFKTFPDLEILINSASVFKRSSILETSHKLFDEMFNINFKAPFFLVRDFVRLVKKGNIINILDTKISGSGFAYAAYTLSKKALEDLTLMSAKEFGPGIRVNGIAPGLILPPEGETSDYLDKIAANIPLKKRGDISNILKTVHFILDNDYITGQVIYVDGGQKL
jgi:pteridine reductase